MSQNSVRIHVTETSCVGCRRAAKNPLQPCRIHTGASNRGSKRSHVGKGVSGDKNPAKRTRASTRASKASQPLTAFFSVEKSKESEKGSSKRSKRLREKSQSLLTQQERDNTDSLAIEEEEDEEITRYSSVYDDIEDDSTKLFPSDEEPVPDVEEEEEEGARVAASARPHLSRPPVTRTGSGTGGSTSLDWVSRASDKPYTVPQGVPERVRHASGRTQCRPLPSMSIPSHVPDAPDYPTPIIREQLRRLKGRAPLNLSVQRAKFNLIRQQHIQTDRIEETRGANTNTGVIFGPQPGVVGQFQSAFDAQYRAERAAFAKGVTASGDGEDSDEDEGTSTGIVHCGLNPQRYVLPPNWTSPVRVQSTLLSASSRR